MADLSTSAGGPARSGAVDRHRPLAPVSSWLGEFDQLREALWSEVRGPLRDSELGSIGAQFELDGYREHIRRLAAAPDDLPRPSGAIVIAGLARTGTTLLQGLLDATGIGHAPQCWETYAYGARPGSANAEAAVALARARVELVRDLSPRLFGLHPFGVFEPEECTPTVAASLVSEQTAFMFPCPRFEQQFIDGDDRLMYALWTRQISLLAGASELPLILKSPLHLGHYGRILEILPDASIVQIRRPIEDVIRSWLNLAEVARGIFAPSVDPVALGREWMARVERLLERGAAESARYRRHIVTVEYEDLRRQPAEVVARFSGAAGLSEREYDACAAAGRRLDTLHSSPLRPLVRYGLDAPTIRRTFAAHLGGWLVV